MPNDCNSKAYVNDLNNLETDFAFLLVHIIGS
jgi:hypothetical protein